MKPLLSPKEFAGAIGVSQSSIKRWADDGLIRVTRTAGGHRRIPLAEAIRFLRETEAELVQPHVLGLPASTRMGRGSLSLDEAADELTRHLEKGASTEAMGMIHSLYLSGYQLAQIIDGPVLESMTLLGEAWQKDRDEGIFVEHRATQILFRTFHELRSILPENTAGPVAIGGAPSGDPYQLSSLLVAAVLDTEGYQAINLGPETPITMLRQAAITRRPRLVWLSISSAPTPVATSAEIGELLDELVDLGIAAAIGGRVVDQLHLPVLSGTCVGRSMAELVAFVKGLGMAVASPADASTVDA